MARKRNTQPVADIKQKETKPVPQKTNGKNQQPMTVPEVIHKNRVRAESREEIRRFIFKIILVVLVVYLAFQYVWGLAIVKNMDMGPALKDGDLVLFFRLDRDYVLTDVVKYTVGGQEYFGRVVALAGDTVDVSDDGTLMINGSYLEEEEIYYSMDKELSAVEFPYVVGENRVFVLGDYRTEATDSRKLGAINTATIDGKVIGYFRRRGI